METTPADGFDYPPFRPYGLCPKCLSSVVTATYRAAGGCLHNLGPTNDHEFVTTDDGADQNPRMCRHCTDCGYGWDELPADVAVELPDPDAPTPPTGESIPQPDPIPDNLLESPASPPDLDSPPEPTPDAADEGGGDAGPGADV